MLVEEEEAKRHGTGDDAGHLSLHAGALALVERGIEGGGVNVFGALKVARGFTRPMIEQRRDSVMKTVSGGILHFSHGGAYTALGPNSQKMPYMASKAALATRSFYMADALNPMNVAVNIIIPGHTRGFCSGYPDGQW